MRSCIQLLHPQDESQSRTIYLQWLTSSEACLQTSPHNKLSISRRRTRTRENRKVYEENCYGNIVHMCGFTLVSIGMLYKESVYGRQKFLQIGIIAHIYESVSSASQGIFTRTVYVCNYLVVLCFCFPCFCLTFPRASHKICIFGIMFHFILHACKRLFQATY